MKTGSKSLLVNLGRILLFVVSIVVALGWLVAPEVIAKQRERVAAFVRLPAISARDVSPPMSSSQGNVVPAGVRQIAAHPH